MDFETKLQSYVETYSDAPKDVILATRLMVRSASMLESQINCALTPLSIHIHEYLAMMMIKFQGGPLRPTELSDALGISRPQITRLLDSLEGRGLISREHSKTDRRALLLTLTVKGKNQLEAAAPIVHGAYLDSWKNSTKHLSPMLKGLRLLYSTLRSAE